MAELEAELEAPPPPAALVPQQSLAAHSGTPGQPGLSAPPHKLEAQASLWPCKRTRTPTRYKFRHACCPAHATAAARGPGNHSQHILVHTRNSTHPQSPTR